jgi:hypothetical protein
VRALLALFAIVLLTAAAFAQGPHRGPGSMEQRQQAEQQRKKAAEAEKAYKAGLDQIPNVDKKPDPWGDLRGSETGKSNNKSK